MAILVTPSRDEAMNVDMDAVNKRVQTNESLVKEISTMSYYVAEGRAMTGGLMFMSGTELAALLTDTVQLGVAVLQEKGMLAKKLPRQAKAKDDKFDGGYL